MTQVLPSGRPVRTAAAQPVVVVGRFDNVQDDYAVVGPAIVSAFGSLAQGEKQVVTFTPPVARCTVRIESNNALLIEEISTSPPATGNCSWWVMSGETVVLDFGEAVFLRSFAVNNTTQGLADVRVNAFTPGEGLEIGVQPVIEFAAA